MRARDKKGRTPVPALLDRCPMELKWTLDWFDTRLSFADRVRAGLNRLKV